MNLIEPCHSQEEHYKNLREIMVATQIQGYGRDIQDSKVVSAMLKIPRHEFVPDNLKAQAYEDHPLSIGEGQTISQPYIVAFMTEMLKLQGDEKVLEIGTGCGYQAAVLAEIVRDVFTIEIVKPLFERAEQTLRRLGYTNIHLKSGDGYEGWRENAPFDAVIVTCAPDHIPLPLTRQLKLGGRMIIPVGEACSGQELIYLEKVEPDRLARKAVLHVIFVPMTGKAQNNEENYGFSK